MSLAIRPLAPSDASVCDQIILGLPEFFGHEGGRAECARAVRTQPGWVAVDGERVVGFLTWQQRTAVAVEVTWMAVESAHRGRGIGKTLVEHLVRDLAGRGSRLLFTMTSAASKRPAGGPDVYEGTRRFWMRCGFLPLVELDIWETDLALLLVRPLVAAGDG